MAEQAQPAELDAHDASLLATTLAMSVDERMQRLIDYVRFVQAGRAAIDRATA